MKEYIDMFLLSLVTVYIVDLSGFTDSWKGALSAWLKRPVLKSIKPFDCSLCMTWWVCLTYALISGHLTLPFIAYAALLSFLSYPMGQILIFIREGILALINKLMGLL